MEWINQKPWEGLSVDINPNISPREMVYKVKLDSEKSWNPTGGVRPGRPKSYANQEMFQFFKSFTENGGLSLETIGTLDNGRIVWGLAALKEEFTLIKTDEIKSYLMLYSRNINRDIIEIQFTTFRQAGGNTLQIPCKGRTFFKNICRRPFTKQFPFISLKFHKFDEGLIRKTKETITYGREAIIDFSNNAESLINIKVNDKISKRYMFDVFQPEISKKLPSIGNKEVNELADKKTKISLEAITKAPGQNLNDGGITAWDLINAVTYAVDHCIGSDQGSRLRLGWFGPNSKFKQRALDLAQNLK
jgi:hypothetical protein